MCKGSLDYVFRYIVMSLTVNHTSTFLMHPYIFYTTVVLLFSWKYMCHYFLSIPITGLLAFCMDKHFSKLLSMDKNGFNIMHFNIMHNYLFVFKYEFFLLRNYMIMWNFPCFTSRIFLSISWCYVLVHCIWIPATNLYNIFHSSCFFYRSYHMSQDNFTPNYME